MQRWEKHNERRNASALRALDGRSHWRRRLLPRLVADIGLGAGGRSASSPRAEMHRLGSGDYREPRQHMVTTGADNQPCAPIRRDLQLNIDINWIREY
jgi:hypothetical protein